MNIIPRGEIRTMKMIFFLLIHVQVDFSYKKHSALRKHDFLYFFILFLFHFFFNLFTRLQHFKMALLRHCTYNKSVFSASFWKEKKRKSIFEAQTLFKLADERVRETFCCCFLSLISVDWKKGKKSFLRWNRMWVEWLSSRQALNEYYGVMLCVPPRIIKASNAHESLYMYEILITHSDTILGGRYNGGVINFYIWIVDRYILRENSGKCNKKMCSR